MFPSPARLLAAFTLLVLTGAGAVAQKPDEPFDYRRFLKPPQTTAEFWEAMKFEMEVGRFDLAAVHLSEMLKKNPTPEDLLKLHEKEGIAYFLKLRLVPRWFADRDKDRATREDVEKFIDLVTDAVRNKLTDPQRIQLFINNLYGEPDEVGFARRELAKSGTAAVPYILEEMLRRAPEDRGPILDLLDDLGHDTVLPLLAALDIPSDSLRENILDVLLNRKDLFLLKNKGVEVAPALRPLASSLNQNRAIKDKALRILTIVHDLRSPDRLPSPLLAITAEAERFYYHRYLFQDPNRVPIWRWDGKKIVEDSSFTASKAEEYMGLRHARTALAIDPNHQPAQLVMLGLLIDKGYQAPTPEKPLGTLRPTVEDLLPTLSVDLLNSMLEGALRDERVPVILSVIRALGKIGDIRGLRAQTQGEPTLVRALAYGDRRVQMAAVNAILSIPGSASTQATTRIVEILKGVLAPDFASITKPRILVASGSDSYLRDMVQAIEQSGAEAVQASTGREAVKRLMARADIDAAVLDGSMPEPGLSWVLAQLRADQTLRRLPLFVAAIPDTALSRDVLRELRDERVKLGYLEQEIRRRIEDRARLELVSTYLSARAGEDVILTDARKRKAALDDRIDSLASVYQREAYREESKLRALYSDAKHLYVVSSGQVLDPRLLAVRIEEQIRATGMPPLSPAERKEYVEMALSWLARMATGELQGYDVKPIEDAVVQIIQAPGLDEPATLNALRILGRTPGSAAQRQLIVFFLDGKRPLPVRVLAGDELLRHMQEFGKPDPMQQKILNDAVLIALKEPGLDAALRDRMTRMVGALGPSNRANGERLRGFMP